jgi:hypothetical protein
MGMRGPKSGLVLLVMTACSNDQFLGNDAGDDAVADAREETTADVVEASSMEGGPTGFCASPAQSGAFFCDDFDTLTPVTASFSVWTPGSIAFGAGVTGQGLVVTAVAVTSPTVFITKQVQGNVLHELDFAMQLGSATLATYVKVSAGASAFGLGVDLGANFTIQGDSNSNATLAKADTNWHVVVVKFESGKANVVIDGKSPVSVTFAAASPTASSVDLGVVVGTLGGMVSFDDVALR